MGKILSFLMPLLLKVVSKDQVGSIVRSLLKIAGGWLLSSGFSQDAVDAWISANSEVAAGFILLLIGMALSKKANN